MPSIHSADFHVVNGSAYIKIFKILKYLICVATNIFRYLLKILLMFLVGYADKCQSGPMM